ncbi:MAG: complex I 24 kDa subunit family protein [bacterium]
MKVQFSKKSRAQAEEIIRRYPQKRAAMLPILHLAESEFGAVSPEVEVYVGELLEVPPVKVHEVMTFYTMLASKLRGKHHFQVCRGLSCDLRGCTKIIDYLSDQLKLKPGESSEDLQFTFSTVECLGACETAPMMQLNDDYIGDLTEQKIADILKKLNSKGNPE